MGKSRGASENSKKAQGNARKAAAADKKRQDEADREEASEAADWDRGSKKGNAKKEAETEKKAEAARKKAERDAALAAEEAALPSKPTNRAKRGAEKIAERRTRGLDSFLAAEDAKESTLHASGIDDALAALELTGSKASGNKADVERHPERRYKAAHAAYEEQRLPELKLEHPGLRMQQYKELIHKEFEKSPENPFNQVSVSYNASRSDVHAKQTQVRAAAERRLAER
ncbi:uncharacterized protein SAPINGB_P006376 [Magnusiomyces paraingens]|uniref:DUF1014-domain-containing protein n=1 Tax=Magnusiomyces paraingens TaxID=2606893 RepID=A0A5E8C5U2_9ASCO|nr:uncharacterized protein SAPINGB_P006376 [Saprochaete ingens]VVT58772.1 unnamed protein product [Saprochaete ingens]